MNGRIIQISRRGIMFIVQIDGGDYAVFELLDSIEIAVGDAISGELEGLGGEELLHLGHGKPFRVYGQSGPSSLKACQRLIAAH